MVHAVHQLDKVGFIAGKHFVSGGVEYNAGDPIEDATVFRSIESMIRGRFIIPVVDDMADVPRLYWKEVRHRSEILSRYGVEDKREKSKPAKKAAAKKTADKA